MADQRIVNFEGKTQVFPADATDAEISAALNAIPASNATEVPKAKTWAPYVAFARPVTETALKGAEELATNPSVPRGAAAIGRAVGAVEGAMKGGPLAIGPGAWAGGKGGWFSGKVLQSASAPVAKALEKAAPYAQALSTLGGAQSALDVAQMAEPNRKDIGTLGVTVGDAHDPAHPALVNLLLSKAGEGISKLVDKGMSAEDALAAWLKGKR